MTIKPSNLIGAASGTLGFDNPARVARHFAASTLDFLEWHPSSNWALTSLFLATKAFSVHIPTKNNTQSHIVYNTYLKLMQDTKNSIGFVLHPAEALEWDKFGNGEYICIENLDSRTPQWSKPKDIAKAFAKLPQAKFCFDIAHAFENDPSGTLAHEFVDLFGSRISHIHYSYVAPGGMHYSPEVKHCKLYKNVLKKLPRTPIVLEPGMSMPVDDVAKLKAMVAEYLPWD